ncbi:MAG: restriction endonuclease subunit S [Pseudomonadota bacterium]
MIWKKIKLKKLLTKPVQNGYSPICPATSSGQWILGLGALNGSGLDITQIKPAPVDDHRVEKFLLFSGDFLISRSNTLDKVGRTALFKGQIEHCAYPDLMMRFRADDPRIHLAFLEYYLRSSEAVRHFRRAASGTSGSMMKISKIVVENLQVPLPPLGEQNAIASILSTWDVAIEKIEQLIAAKEQKNTRLINNLFSTDKHPRVHIRDFTTEVSKRNNGTAINRVLSVTNNKGFVLPEDRFERRVASSDLSNYKVVTSGQYAYNPSRINVGSIARLDGWDAGVLSPMYVVFKIDEKKVDSDFFLHWLSSHDAKAHIRRSAQGSVRETVSFKDLGAISFPMPLLDKQIEVTSILNIARKEIDLLRKQLEAHRKQKRGLMQKLLTGTWQMKSTKGCGNG